MRILPLLALTACLPMEPDTDPIVDGWTFEPRGDQASEVAPPPLAFDQDTLVVGTDVDFTVVGAAPGDTIRFLYSLTGVGSGPCVPALGGLCLELLPPIELIGTATADGIGDATLTAPLPPTAPLVFLHTQAVVDRGMVGSVATNTITAPILAGSLDVDGDGYCGGATCADPYALPGDCMDDDPAVHPGVTAYSGMPYFDGLAWSYDYDCDGTETRKNPSRYTCTYNGGLPFCPYTEGWSGFVPDCGEARQWDYGCTEFPGLPICFPTGSTTVTQRCR